MPVARRLILLFIAVLVLSSTVGWVASRFLKRIFDPLGSGRKEVQIKSQPRPPRIHPIVDEDGKTAGLPLDQALDVLDCEHDPDALNKFSVVVASRFRREKFEELDRTADQLLKAKARFPGGAWKIHRFIGAIGECPGGADRPETDWQAHLGRFRKWMAQQPGSATAPVAYAQGLTNYAWKARGEGWASEVSKDGWNQFGDRLKQARNILQQAPKTQPRGPEWYLGMMTVALGQSWERDEYEKLFAEAIKSEPLYFGLYSAKAYFLLPRWHGAEGEWEDFATDAADRIGGAKGDAMYYFIVSGQVPMFDSKVFFKNPKISWPRMKRGFTSIEKEYRMSYPTLNAYCHLAGRAGDRPEALAAFARIGTHWDPDTWKTKDIFDNFKDWANREGEYAKR